MRGEPGTDFAGDAAVCPLFFRDMHTHTHTEVASHSTFTPAA